MMTRTRTTASMTHAVREVDGPSRCQPSSGGVSRRKPRQARSSVVVAFAALMSFLLLSAAWQAYAVEARVGLGTAASFSVLGGSTVTNTGPTVLSGDLGVSPGTAITGFPPGIVNGTTHDADAVAAQAQSDLVIAYNDASGRASTGSVAGNIGGLTFTSGVYTSTSSLALTGTVTLDGQGNPNAVFIFQIASTLTTASASTVSLINGAQSCNVFWQVGSSATLGTASTFKGTIMALTSITATTGATVDGRALARNGAVTLDTNTFTMSQCAIPPGTPGQPSAVPGDSSATITVVPPTTGGTPTSYTVTASPGGQTCTVTGSSGSCTITGLTNGTSYTFTVTATNADGTSGPSLPSNAVIPFAVTPPPPPPHHPGLPTTGSDLAPAGGIALGLMSIGVFFTLTLGRKRFLRRSNGL